MLAGQGVVPFSKIVRPAAVTQSAAPGPGGLEVQTMRRTQGYLRLHRMVVRFGQVGRKRCAAVLRIGAQVVQRSVLEARVADVVGQIAVGILALFRQATVPEKHCAFAQA